MPVRSGGQVPALRFSAAPLQVLEHLAEEGEQADRVCCRLPVEQLPRLNVFEQRNQQEQLVKSLEDAVRLSNLRYKGGLDSYLQVLDAQRTLFSGELGLAQLRLAERLSVVQLYRALGGGWQ